MTSRATIKAIAKEAGVSIATVDRVIHNRGRVKAETEKKIRDICDRLQYESNNLAKALVFAKNETHIAVIVADAQRNAFTRQVKCGFDQALAKLKDYNVHIKYYFLYDDPVKETLQYLEKLEHDRPDGIIIKPTDNEQILGRLLELKKAGVPIVTCTSEMPRLDPLCFIGQDHYREGRIAASMLCSMHKAGSELGIIINPPAVYAQQQRLDGFLSYLKEAGDPLKIVEILKVRNDSDVVFAESYAFLKKHPTLSALYLHTSYVGATMKALEIAERKDITAFTFGCRAELTPFLLSGLLSFAMEEEPFYHGNIAAAAMFNWLFDRTLPSAPKIYMKPQLLLREALVDNSDEVHYEFLDAGSCPSSYNSAW